MGNEIRILKLTLEISNLEGKLLSLSHVIALESNRCSDSKFLNELQLEYAKLNRELLHCVEEKVFLEKVKN